VNVESEVQPEVQPEVEAAKPADVLGDIRIDVPASSQVHHPLVRLYFVQVAEPVLAYPNGDLQQLLVALELDWQLTGLNLDPLLLPALQTTLRQR